jgi:two-component system chemotaxis response regulator CheB
VEALRAFVAGLPESLDAGVLIVLHVPRSAPSALPQILSRVTGLSVTAAVNGQRLRRRHVYVAPPNHHLLLIANRIRLSRGPAENGHRPAVDPLFRSAANSYGPRVIGVVLSGSRDDGAAGVAAIAAGDGLVLIQEPTDALYPSMPLAAQRATKPDYVLPAGKLGELVGEITARPILSGVPTGSDSASGLEVAVANNEDVTINEELANPAGYGCPACGGSLFEIDGPEPVTRFRCRIGHAWTAQALLEEQSAALEGALWTALRALEEKAALGRQMAEAAGERQHHHVQDRYRTASQEAGEAAEVIREMIERLGAIDDRLEA